MLEPRASGSRAPIAAAVLAGLLALAASPAAARAKTKTKKGRPAAARAAKRAPQPKIVPDQQGKIVMFPFRDDDDHAVGAQVERLLRARGLEVVTGVRKVDTAEQYRDMATALGLVAYVDGNVKEGMTASRVTLQIRSGYTGRTVAQTMFKESNLHLSAEIEDNLWTRLGPGIARACTDAAKPRKRGHGPLLIEAGTPLESPAPGKPRGERVENDSF
jgi:hypothetical protein